MKSEQTTRGRLISKLKDHYGVTKNTDLANALAISKKKKDSWNSKISAWPKDPKPLSHNEILTLVKDSMDAVVKREREEIHRNFITPIAEYFPIEKVESRQGKNYEIFSTNNESSRQNQKVRKYLEDAKTGIYAFYDSRGRAIYVGQTGGQIRRQTNTLWSEMKIAFNRKPNEIQKLYRIDHRPNARAQEKKLGLKPVQLHELAKYFSAYKINEDIHPNMIHNIEALLIRAFASDLVNKRMEDFK